MIDERHNEDRRTAGERFWEAHYQKQERVWSGQANAVLVDVVASLPAGSALDLGCAEGGDALWLAQHGVTAQVADNLIAVRRHG